MNPLKGEDETAVDWGLKARSTNPRLVGAYLVLAAAYANLGKNDEARTSLAEARRLNSFASILEMREGFGSHEAAYVRLAERYYGGLRKAGMSDE